MMVVATVVNAQEFKDITVTAFSVGRHNSLNRSKEVAKEADWIQGKRATFEEGIILNFNTSNMGDFFILVQNDVFTLNIENSKHNEETWYGLQSVSKISDSQILLSFFTELGFYSIYVQLTEE